MQATAIANAAVNGEWIEPRAYGDWAEVLEGLLLAVTLIDRGYLGDAANIIAAESARANALTD